MIFFRNTTLIVSYSTTVLKMPIFIIFRLLYLEIKNFVMRAPLHISKVGLLLLFLGFSTSKNYYIYSEIIYSFVFQT
jgi:hypothetical protein